MNTPTPPKVRRFATLTPYTQEHIVERSDGDYVLFSDYAELLERYTDNEIGDQKNRNERDALKAKLAALEAELEEQRLRTVRLIQSNNERVVALSAEVQKLREALKHEVGVVNDFGDMACPVKMRERMVDALNSNAGEKETQ